MSQSILLTTKRSLGVPDAHTAFDNEIMIHLNSALSTLTQLGVGPLASVYVEDASTKWSELIGSNNNLNGVKTYVHLRVKILFDPPDTGFVLTAMKELIQELEWRLNVAAEEGISIPLSFTAGDAVRRRILIRDPDPASPDPDNPVMIPRNLTGWTARAQIRKNAESSSVIATFQVTGLGADGFVYLYLSPEESRKVTGDAVWDLELTPPNGEVETIPGGSITSYLDVSRD